MASIQNPLGETTSVQYDTLGRPSRKTLSSGQYEEFAYDNRWRPTGITLKNSSGAALRTQAYTYAAASQVLSHTVDGAATIFGYDAASQLVSETRSGYSASYLFDGNGNRLSRTVDGLAETYAYDAGDKLLSVTWAGGAKTYGYDAAGRTTSVTTGSGTTTIAYDWESRITSMTGPGLSQTNAYNGLDTPVAKNAQPFLRDGAYVTDPVLKDGQATFTPSISERRGSTTTFQHSGLKNADAQSGIAQTLTATKQYDAFGNLASSSGTWQGPFEYAGGFGYQTESDSGLMLLGHRYMDPSTGRFLTRDPIKDGRNWYGHVGNNPVAFADPDGLRMWSFQKWLAAGDGFASDVAYEGGLVQLDGSLSNWWGHFKDRNEDLWEIPAGLAGGTGALFLPTPKPVGIGGRAESSVAREISVWYGRRFGRGGPIQPILKRIADAVKEQIINKGKIRGTGGPMLVAFLWGEAILAWGAAFDTLKDPLVDTSVLVE